MTPPPHHDHMDATLDRTLHALGNAEPTPGMSARLQAALVRRRTNDNSDCQPYRPASWRSHPALTVFALGSLLAVFAPLAYRGIHRPELPPTAATSKNNDTVSHSPQAHLQASLRLLRPENSPESRRPSAQTSSSTTSSSSSSASPLTSPPWLSSPKGICCAGPSAAVAPIHLGITASSSGKQVASNSTPLLDMAAAADLHTPSYPAPPLPPTAQERMVRLMLRRGERHDLAQLDPARAAVFAQEQDAALEEFFNPPWLAPSAADLRLLSPSTSPHPEVPTQSK